MHFPCAPLALQPRLLYYDASILQDGSDFVDDDLHLDQQPALPSLHGDATFNPIVREVGEGERAVGSHIETWTLVGLDDPAAVGHTQIW